MTRKSSPPLRNRKKVVLAPGGPTTALTAATMRVLVADDHARVREEIVRLLVEKNGLRHIRQAADGVEAMELIMAAQRKTPYHLLVTDNHMPRMTGLELLQFTSHHTHHETRLIMVSSDSHISQGLTGDMLPEVFPHSRFVLKDDLADLPETVRDMFPEVAFIGQR